MKKYTSHDLREVASALSSSGVNLKFDKRDISDMLRQAADMMDRAEKAIVANDESREYKHKDWKAVLATSKYILTGSMD